MTRKGCCRGPGMDLARPTNPLRRVAWNILIVIIITGQVMATHQDVSSEGEKLTMSSDYNIESVEYDKSDPSDKLNFGSLDGDDGKIVTKASDKAKDGDERSTIIPPTNLEVEAIIKTSPPVEESSSQRNHSLLNDNRATDGHSRVQIAAFEINEPSDNLNFKKLDSDEEDTPKQVPKESKKSKHDSKSIATETGKVDNIGPKQELPINDQVSSADKKVGISLSDGMETQTKNIAALDLQEVNFNKQESSDDLHFNELDYDGTTANKLSPKTTTPQPSDFSFKSREFQSIMPKAEFESKEDAVHLESPSSYEIEKEAPSDELHFKDIDFDEGDAKSKENPGKSAPTPLPVETSHIPETVQGIVSKSESTESQSKSSEPVSQEFEKEEPSDDLHFKDIDFDEGDAKSKGNSGKPAPTPLPVETSHIPETVQGIVSKSESTESQYKSSEPVSHEFEKEEPSDELHFKAIDFDEGDAKSKGNPERPVPTSLPVDALKPVDSAMNKMTPMSDLTQVYRKTPEPSSQEFERFEPSDALHFDVLDYADEVKDKNKNQVKASSHSNTHTLDRESAPSQIIEFVSHQPSDIMNFRSLDKEEKISLPESTNMIKSPTSLAERKSDQRVRFHPGAVTNGNKDSVGDFHESFIKTGEVAGVDSNATVWEISEPYENNNGRQNSSSSNHFIYESDDEVLDNLKRLRRQLARGDEDGNGTATTGGDAGANNDGGDDNNDVDNVVDDGSGSVVECDGNEQYKCPSCFASTSTDGFGSLTASELCDQQQHSITCNNSNAACKTKMYMDKRGISVIVEKGCGDAPDRCDILHTSNKPTDQQHQGICTTNEPYSYEGHTIHETCINNCIQSEGGCYVIPGYPGSPCPVGVQCLRCNTTSRAECVAGGEWVNCSNSDDVCVVSKITDQRGREVEFHSECTTESSYSTECAIKETYQCSPHTTLGYEKCIRCDVPDSCSTDPDYLDCSTGSVHTCWYCDTDNNANCTATGYNEVCSNSEDICREESWLDARGTQRRAIHGCATSCTAQACAQDTAPRYNGEIGRTCITCESPTLMCREDVEGPTTCPAGEEQVCIVCTGATKAECDRNGQPSACSGTDPRCHEQQYIDSLGTLVNFTRSCSTKDRCPSAGCRTPSQGGTLCDDCLPLSTCARVGAVICSAGLMAACRTCVHVESYAQCDNGGLQEAASGVCESIEETFPDGSFRVSRTGSLDPSLCDSIGPGECHDISSVTISGQRVTRRRCCAYATECSDSPMPTTRTPTFNLAPATCPAAQTRQCWKCIRASSSSQCDDPNINNWETCDSDQEYCYEEETLVNGAPQITKGCKQRADCLLYHDVTLQCSSISCSKPIIVPVVYVWIIFDIVWNPALAIQSSLAYWALKQQIEAFFNALLPNTLIIYIEVLSFSRGSVITSLRLTLADNVTTLNEAGEVGKEVQNEVAAVLVNRLLTTDNTFVYNGDPVSVRVDYVFSTDPSTSFNNNTNITAVDVLDVCELSPVCDNGGSCVADEQQETITCSCQPGYSGAACQNVTEESDDISLILVLGILGPIALLALVAAIVYCVRHVQSKRKQNVRRISRTMENRYDRRETGSWGTRTLALTPHRGWRNYIGQSGVMDDSRETSWDPNDGQYAPVHRNRFIPGRSWNSRQTSDRGPGEPGSYFY